MDTLIKPQHLFDKSQIDRRVKILAGQISSDYTGSDLLLLGILKGSVVFLSDLMRQISIPHEIDFMSVSSYGKGARQSSGVVKIIKDLDGPIADKHVLIIEDIVDSGYTLSYLIKVLWARKPASLKICTLLDKAERRKVDVPVTYLGFPVPDYFVVGYGMDADEKWRHLDYIGRVD